MNNFESIYEENYRRMYGVAYKMIHDREAVNDLIQEIFIGFYRLQEREKQVLNPRNWLIRATINKSIDYLNAQKRYLKLDTAEANVIVDEESEFKGDAELIKLALQVLNEKERAIVSLYSEGMSYKEIADLSGVKFNSVGKTLARSLQKLNEQLKKMTDEMF